MERISLLDALINSTGSTYSGTTLSGLSNVYSFIDTKGNVTQIRKAIKKQRNKFYIDPEITFFAFYELCVIGITDEENGECSFGLALGMGDERSSTEMAFAIYD